MGYDGGYLMNKSQWTTCNRILNNLLRRYGDKSKEISGKDADLASIIMILSSVCAEIENLEHDQ